MFVIVIKGKTSDQYYNEDSNKWGFFYNATKYTEKEIGAATFDQLTEANPNSVISWLKV